MSYRRSINWNAALRDLRNDRAEPVAGYLANRSLEIARLTRIAQEAAARPFVVAGAFDRAAIMGAAIAQARLERAKGNKAAWTVLLASALRFAWARAKATRVSASH